MNRKLKSIAFQKLPKIWIVHSITDKKVEIYCKIWFIYVCIQFKKTAYLETSVTSLK